MAAPPERPDAPLWLSHHQPSQHERCVRLGARLVCRRCLVLYPVAVASWLVVAIAGWSPAPWWLFVLPFPAVVEWWAEHLDRWTYVLRRQVVVTVLAGVGLGLGFARYLADPLDPWFWSMVALYGGTGAAAALWRVLDRSAP